MVPLIGFDDAIGLFLGCAICDLSNVWVVLLAWGIQQLTTFAPIVDLKCC